MTYRFRNIFLRLFFISGILGIHIFSSCNKLVSVQAPNTVLVSSTVYSNPATATAALLGIYSKMMEDLHFPSINTTLYAGLAADELLNYSSTPALAEFYQNALTTTNPDINAYWSDAYQYIYDANSVIEGLALSPSLDPVFKKSLTAEAKFIRAFCHFYLVNLFGDVPLITTTNYQSNGMASRAPASQVYAQIISDLKDAQSGLGNDFVDASGLPTAERVRPNQWAATSLLARVYLYTGDWADAESQAAAIINHTELFTLSGLDSVFLKNSTEAIWQLMPVTNSGPDTWEGYVFNLTTAPSGISGTALSPQVMQAFETGDQRSSHWTDSITAAGQTFHYAYKYKVKTTSVFTEYYMVLRLAEQYLIRAEAQANQNKIPSATADLNLIRERSGLPDLDPGQSQQDCLLAIQRERRVEFFAEWGQRWLDLKRTGQSGIVLAPLKTNWQATDTLFPIPQTEIASDPNLTQNQGY
jgi:hypothetical protein